MNDQRRRSLHWFLILTWLFSSCTNEIELFSPDEEKTYVVYGLINYTDPLQLVKVRFTSITDATQEELAENPDEFAVPENLEVSVQEWLDVDYICRTYLPVTWPKQPGLFFNTPNTVYESRFNPDLDREYKLVIYNPETGDQVTSTIFPVPAPALKSPTWPWIRYNFSDEADPFNIRFREVPRAYVYLVRFTVRYLEVLFGNDSSIVEDSYVFKPRYADQPPEYNPLMQVQGSEHNRYMSSQYTYSILNSCIPVRDSLLYRQLICFKVSVWGGDENLRNYVRLSELFSDNRRFIFNNINNGIGVFGACAYASCDGILPDVNFMDSLPLHSLSAALRFRPDLFREKSSVSGSAEAHPGFMDILGEVGYE